MERMGAGSGSGKRKLASELAQVLAKVKELEVRINQDLPVAARELCTPLLLSIDRSIEISRSEWTEPKSPRSSISDQNDDDTVPMDKVTLRQVQRRLAQNREAAQRSRLWKAYIHRLEQQQQDMYRSCSIGESVQSMAAPMDSGTAAAFEMEYAHWVEEQGRSTNELRTALQAPATEHELRMLVEAGLANYTALFKIRSVAARSDALYVFSGTWMTPVERFFLWIGGFRPSGLLTTLAPHLEPLTEPQASAVRRLQQSARQAEDALQQRLVDSLATADSEDNADAAGCYPTLKMATTVNKLEALAGFIDQADHLRHQTLQNMHEILTTRQAARGLLALGEYRQRLRQLSSLWAARPREAN